MTQFETGIKTRCFCLCFHSISFGKSITAQTKGSESAMDNLFYVAFFAAVLVVSAQVSMHNPNYCYSSDPIRPQNGMHSTQSSYEAILRSAINVNVSCK